MAKIKFKELNSLLVEAYEKGKEDESLLIDKRYQTTNQNYEKLDEEFIKRQDDFIDKMLKPYRKKK